MKEHKERSYIWAILVNLIALGIILFLFDSAYDVFQTRIYAILVIVYISIQGLYLQHISFSIDVGSALDNEFRRVRELLKDTQDEADLEKREKTRLVAEKREHKMLINAVFMFITFLIALWNLFGTL